MTVFRCIGGRSEIDDAAAALNVFALGQRGLAADASARSEAVAAAAGSLAVPWSVTPPTPPARWCATMYASSARAEQGHAAIDYEVAPTPALPTVALGSA